MRADPSRLATALWAARSYAGPLLAAGGVVLEVIGWFCVSGESLAARQLPYIASASIPGAALIVSGAVLTAGRRPADYETARRVAELHALLVEYAPGPDGPADAGGTARPAPPQAVPAAEPEIAAAESGTGNAAVASPGTAENARDTAGPEASPAAGSEISAAGAESGAGNATEAAVASPGTAENARDAAGPGAVPAAGPTVAAAGGTGDGAGPVAVPAGTTFHDPACDLVRGKPSARVSGEQIAARGLLPCPVCAPDPG